MLHYWLTVVGWLTDWLIDCFIWLPDWLVDDNWLMVDVVCRSRYSQHPVYPSSAVTVVAWAGPGWEHCTTRWLAVLSPPTHCQQHQGLPGWWLHGAFTRWAALASCRARGQWLLLLTHVTLTSAYAPFIYVIKITISAYKNVVALNGMTSFSWKLTECNRLTKLQTTRDNRPYSLATF